MAVANLGLLLAAAALLVDGPLPHGPGDWLTLAWVTTLGLLAVVPLGAAIGSVLPNPREALALLMLPTMGLLFTSGTVFPITSLPVPVQQVAAVFPPSSGWHRACVRRCSPTRHGPPSRPAPGNCPWSPWS